MKDPNVIRSITPGGVNPDGRLNVASLQTDFDFFRSQNQIIGNIRVEDAIEESYVRTVFTQLGPYKRKA